LNELTIIWPPASGAAKNLLTAASQDHTAHPADHLIGWLLDYFYAVTVSPILDANLNL